MLTLYGCIFTLFKCHSFNNFVYFSLILLPLLWLNIISSGCYISPIKTYKKWSFVCCLSRFWGRSSTSLFCRSPILYFLTVCTMPNKTSLLALLLISLSSYLAISKDVLHFAWWSCANTGCLSNTISNLWFFWHNSDERYLLHIRKN